MNSSKIRAGVLASVLVVTGAFGLAGCSSDTGASEGSSASQSATTDVATDLETARAAVEEALAENSEWTQVMLAGDVKQPTQKYGLLVMPFVKSDAAKKVTGTVNIDGGRYVIEAESAASGETWQIDQDGNISQVSD